MGTRGLVGFVIDGEVKATYNHFDSYPTGLGYDVVSAIQSNKISVDAVRGLRMEPLDGNDANYHELRSIQGDLLAHLEVGRMIDNADFAADSLFCEWGYLVNMDTDTLEVYRGFVQDQTRGRFAGLESAEGGYLPISLIAEIHFTDVSTEEMDRIEKEVYGEDE